MRRGTGKGVVVAGSGAIDETLQDGSIGHAEGDKDEATCDACNWSEGYLAV